MLGLVSKVKLTLGASIVLLLFLLRVPQTTGVDFFRECEVQLEVGEIAKACSANGRFLS